MLQGLDEQQSVQLLQCYLQEDYRGTRDSLKVPVTTFFHEQQKTSDAMMTNIQTVANGLFHAGCSQGWATKSGAAAEGQFRDLQPFTVCCICSIFNPITNNSPRVCVCIFTDSWLLLRWAHVSAQMCPALADILSGRAASLQGEKQLDLRINLIISPWK